ncbi:unnamed protein product [Clonostachys rosea]|uniref:Uncharacterized protein n=1 Tax=Bionectria ochroleuca TaxID=29856 RepID=A0ABY6UNX8_BIOOC|nr:unnamed protein product [Clonostachys rosea]
MSIGSGAPVARGKVVTINQLCQYGNGLTVQQVWGIGTEKKWETLMPDMCQKIDEWSGMACGCRQCEQIARNK